MADSVRARSAPVASWADVLRAGSCSEKPWLIVPEDPRKGRSHQQLGFGVLHERSLGVRSALQRLGARPGDRLIILADNSAECAAVMLSALASGFTLVPLPPAGLNRSAQGWIAATCGVQRETSARLMIGNVPEVLLRVLPQGVRATTFGALMGASADERPVDGGRGADLAIIQYTSGSTGSPRGTAITVDNLFHNLHAIGEAVAAGHDDVGVSWLPLFHDMGLVGNLLFCAFWQIPLVLLRPLTFLTSPHSWLRAISDYGATFSAAPNSAYQRCVHGIPSAKLDGLDLSSWRVAFNGSELVHEQTVSAFSERFAPFGFRAEAMYPVYGLAENTLASCMPRAGERPHFDWIDTVRLESEQRAVAVPENATARAVACLGMPLQGQEVRVVDPDTLAPLPPREVGEIQLKGASTCAGYWQPDGFDRDCLTTDGWLKTGDRGYLTADGIHVVGRSKHLIKRFGRSIDCAAVENAVRSSVRIRGAVAAFGVPDPSLGTEKLVVLVEHPVRHGTEADELVATIIASLGTAGWPVDVVQLVRPAVIPRTSSGKTRNTLARDLYERQTT